MNSIRQSDLEGLVDCINKATSSPMASYTKIKRAVLASNGQKYQPAKIEANVGNYHLDYAFSGVQLARMATGGGGVSMISATGHGTKRELYNWMQAFLSGLAAKP